MTKRSGDYLCTLDANDPRLAETIAIAKANIKEFNAKRRAYEEANPKFVEWSWSGKQRVKERAVLRVRGRLGKNNPNAHLYRRGGKLHTWTSQDIRPEHSLRFDIYVSSRRDYVPVK